MMRTRRFQNLFVGFLAFVILETVADALSQNHIPSRSSNARLADMEPDPEIWNLDFIDFGA